MANENQYRAGIHAIHEKILDVQPSCVEFSPAFKGIFLIGSYTLEEETDASRKVTHDGDEGQQSQTRSGNLSVFKLEEDMSTTLLQTHTVEAGVLDVQFSPLHTEILAVALSDGTLQLKRLTYSSDSATLSTIYSQRLCSGLILAVTWRLQAEAGACLGLTTSDGEVAVIVFPGDFASTEIDPTVLKAHTLEAWTLAWPPAIDNRYPLLEGPDQPHGYLYTGGDDAVLCQWTSGLGFVPDDSEDQALPADVHFERHILHKGVELRHGLLADRKTHEAGVTAVVPLPILHDNLAGIVITGSYDEYIRVLAVTLGSRWKTLAEKRLLGGVWRLKIMGTAHDPGGSTTFVVLASCMHAGCKIVRVVRDEAGTWSIKVEASFEGHQSMNYASDFLLLEKTEERQERRIVVSTSFFDKRLCVWTPDEP